MARILVPPDVLLSVAKQFQYAADQLEGMKKALNQSIITLITLWDGTTRERFFGDFQRTQEEMQLTINHMRITSHELYTIANRFKQTDNKIVVLGLHHTGIPHQKMFMERESILNEMNDFGEGIKKGVDQTADSAVGKVESFIKDPIGTGKQALYDATIPGRIEEILNTGMWAAKMFFDKETREKFNGNVEESGGWSSFLGQKSIEIGSGIIFGKVLKSKHDSGGNGSGTSKKAEGPKKALVKDAGSISKNTENLRTWAKENGWVQQNSSGGVEQWGVKNPDGTFSWRLKLKPEASTREGLGEGSNQPRFDARLDDKGTYINPFTGETGGKSTGTHIPLGK